MSEGSQSPDIRPGVQPIKRGSGHESEERAESRRTSENQREGRLKSLVELGFISEKPSKPHLSISYGDSSAAIFAIDLVQNEGKSSVPSEERTGGEPKHVLPFEEFQPIKELVRRYGKEAGVSAKALQNLDALEPEVVIVLSQRVLQSAKRVRLEKDDFKYAAGSLQRKPEKALLRIQISKVQDPKEELLMPEKVREHLQIETQPIEWLGKKEPKGGGPGTPGPIEVDWTADVPSPVTLDEKLGLFAEELRTIKNLGDTSPDAALRQLDILSKRFSDMKFGRELDPHNESFRKIERAIQTGLGQLREKVTKSGVSEELSESQYIYYGLTTMPKVRNLGKVDELKREPGEADRVIEGLVSAGRLTEDELAEIRGLSGDDLAKFKEGKSDVVDRDIQEEIYKALYKDQMIWLHQKIERLPWDNLDLAQVQNNLSYREFVNAQTEMLPEIAEYSRALSFGSEAKYLYENSGMEPLMQRASLLKATYEVLSKKAYGWDEVVAEIESFITREKLENEDSRLPGLRKRYVANPASLSAVELTYLKDAAVGLYVYEANSDGSVKSMRPKTNKEIEQDKVILGAEAWKVGGFVRWKDKKEVGKMREHLVQVAREVLKGKAEHGIITAEEVAARAKIAAFMGEWVFWRMAGRSAYWGEQGGNEKGEGGGYGEYQMFLTIGFPQFALQEAKGNDEAGVAMRRIMFGADTLASFNEKYVPGMAGGNNFNLGLFDVYTQYTGFYPGERFPKFLHNAGFVRGYGEDQGEYAGDLNDKWERRIEALKSSGVDTDKAWEIVRGEMGSAEKDFLDEYNNLPIVTLASQTSRQALAQIADGSVKPWSDLTDYFGGDFKGADQLRVIIATHDSGFLSNPEIGHVYEAGKVSEGRKRVWQRAKLIKDMLVGTLVFRGKHNRLKNQDDWGSGDIDEVLTSTRNAGLIVERVKRNIEKEVYPKVTGSLESNIPLWRNLMKNPFLHKLAHIYSKKPAEIAVVTIWHLIFDFVKRAGAYTATTFKH